LKLSNILIQFQRKLYFNPISGFILLLGFLFIVQCLLLSCGDYYSFDYLISTRDYHILKHHNNILSCTYLSMQSIGLHTILDNDMSPAGSYSWFIVSIFQLFTYSLVLSYPVYLAELRGIKTVSNSKFSSYSDHIKQFVRIYFSSLLALTILCLIASYVYSTFTKSGNVKGIPLSIEALSQVNSSITGSGFNIIGRSFILNLPFAFLLLTGLIAIGLPGYSTWYDLISIKRLRNRLQYGGNYSLNTRITLFQLLLITVAGLLFIISFRNENTKLISDSIHFLFSSFSITLTHLNGIYISLNSTSSVELFEELKIVASGVSFVLIALAWPVGGKFSAYRLPLFYWLYIIFGKGSVLKKIATSIFFSFIIILVLKFLLLNTIRSLNYSSYDANYIYSKNYLFGLIESFLNLAVLISFVAISHKFSMWYYPDLEERKNVLLF